MLTLEQAALLYRSECLLILGEILSGNKPELENGLCRLITKRTNWAKVMGFEGNNEGSVGYVISSLTMSDRDFSGYFGHTYGWSAKRLGWLCGVVAMTPEDWVARVNSCAKAKC